MACDLSALVEELAASKEGDATHWLTDPEDWRPRTQRLRLRWWRLDTGYG
jgi:hypothetical protein